MDIDKTLLGVVDELYAGALDHTRLTSSFSQITGLAGASGGLMYLMHESDHRIVHGVLSNFDLDSRQQFDGAHAEQGHYYRRMPLGSPVHMHTLWPIEAMTKTSFYHDVLKKQDVLYGGGCLLLRTPNLHGMFVLNRSERGGPFSDNEFNILRVLVPHLRRVMQITLQMNAIASEREVFESTLDKVAVGIVLTDRRGKVLHLNRAAEQIVANDDGLSIRHDRLVAALHDENSRLERLIGQAAGTLSELSPRGGAEQISRPSGLLPWLLLIAPCSDLHARVVVPALPACVILIRDPARRARSSADELRHLFGLTGQESKIATSVAEGHGVAKVADELGLSSLTVRNHLQRVFAKTGTSRQGELARLVGALTI